MSGTITHDKIADLSPRWQWYPGFSLLFDNPGNSLQPFGTHQRLAAHPRIGLYKCLSDVLTAPPLSQIGAFCRLPYSSLHVTALGGINAGNVEEACPSVRDRVRDYLSRLPHSFSEWPSFVECLGHSRLTSRRWKLDFQVRDLVIWGESVLVARLQPAPGAHRAFEQFKRERSALREAYADRFGVAARKPYVPHITLGYFANREGARHAQRLSGEQLKAAAHSVNGESLRLSQVGLYGFTDMATFIRASQDDSER